MAKSRTKNVARISTKRSNLLRRLDQNTQTTSVTDPNTDVTDPNKDVTDPNKDVTDPNTETFGF